MIRFTNLRLQGFGSFSSPFTYQLDYPGVTHITGDNGSGKTTILNALSWCVYGITIKPGSSVVPWDITKHNYKGTMVTVTFFIDKVEYNIIRETNSKGNGQKLRVFKGLHQVSLKGKKETQEFIVETIGYSFNLFKAAILFGQGVMRLTEESGRNKKIIFEEAFDTMFIQKAVSKTEKELGIIREGKRKVEMEKESLQSTIDQLEKSLETNRHVIKHHQKYKDKLVRVLTKKISGYKNKVTQNNEPIFTQLTNELGKKERILKKLQGKVDSEKMERCSNKAFQLQLEIAKLTGQIRDSEDRQRGLKESMIGKKICSTCGQRISNTSHIKAHIEKEILLVVKAKKKLALSKRLITEVEGLLEKGRKLEQKIKVAQKEVWVTKDKLDELNRGLDNKEIFKQKVLNLEEELKRAKENKLSPKLLKKVKSDKKQLNEIKGVLEKTDMELKGWDKKESIKTWLLKDPLSNSGLKAYIFDSMMGAVNNQAKKYSPLVKFTPKLSVDLDSYNKDVNIEILKKNMTIPYADLSGGQKQLVNVTLAFSINDVTTKVKPINVLFFDEVFESLSDENVEIVSNLIAQKSKDRSVHLITHHSKFIPNNAKVVQLALKDGVTVKI